MYGIKKKIYLFLTQTDVFVCIKKIYKRYSCSTQKRKYGLQTLNKFWWTVPLIPVCVFVFRITCAWLCRRRTAAAQLRPCRCGRTPSRKRCVAFVPSNSTCPTPKTTAFFSLWTTAASSWPRTHTLSGLKRNCIVGQTHHLFTSCTGGCKHKRMHSCPPESRELP